MAVKHVRTRQQEFWRAACDSVPDLPPDAEYQVWHFGDGEALARELADLVLHGRKRATAGPLWEAEVDPTMMPVSGGYSLITDFAGEPLLVIRTIAVAIRLYDRVDAGFAAAEGEGDRSLEHWRRAHWDYFSRRCAALGRTPSAVIYPLAPA